VLVKSARPLALRNVGADTCGSGRELIAPDARVCGDEEARRAHAAAAAERLGPPRETASMSSGAAPPALHRLG